MKKKYKVKNLRIRLNLFLIICIFGATCFLSIGYAAITSMNLKIGVSVTSAAYRDMFISNVEYISNNGADLTKSEIVNYVGTMLHSNIYLSATDTSSSITYQVTIINNSDAIKQFTGVTYLDGYYSNNDIQYKLDGFNVKDIIEKGASKTFNITFYYNNMSIINNNQLESYLNFNFDYYFEEENDVDIEMTGEGAYEFAGVSEAHPIDLKNIANISFVVKNGNTASISGIKVEVTYSTTTGSKQSAQVGLYQENSSTPFARQTTQFQGKATNEIVEVIFNNLNIATGQKLSVSFNQQSITNGKVNVTKVVLTPIF